MIDHLGIIEVSQVKNIPQDWHGLMGVPITFLAKHNPKQFEIIGLDREITKCLSGRAKRFTVNGKEKYCRVVIRRTR